MSKKYTIEVPLYSRPVEYLAKINSSDDINIVVYGGIPNSPFHGGRMNFALDGFLLWDRKSLRLNPKQLEVVTAKFYETVSSINASGMSFWVVATNMFVAPQELNDTNLYPIQWLVESSAKHGIKNGVILNNALLEGHLRGKYGDKLLYISSCTKYVSAHKMLSPLETSLMYQEDAAKYDFVVLTPQDSRREKLINNVVRENKLKIIAIANSYCSNACNAYHHYKYTSQENKMSLLRKSSDWHMIAAAIRFMPRMLKCSAFWHILFPVPVEKIAAMQLKAGIVHFKLGRGLGVESLEKLVALVSKKKELVLVLPATDHPFLRLLIYLFLRTPPGTFSLFIIPALTPPEYRVTIINQKLSWDHRDFVGGKLVGISCATVNAASSYYIADRYRQAGSKVVMGGVHVSHLPQEALEHCDAVVIGEAESVWPQVVRDYERGELKRIYEGKPLDDYFSPCFDYFMKLDPRLLYRTGIILSRGCKYRCEFCAPMSGKLRFVKMDQAIALIERVVGAVPRPFGIKPYLVFRDDNIFSNPDYAKELFQKLIPLNIRWMANSSLDIAFDDEALRLAHKSGCHSLFIGFETINPQRFAKTSVAGVRTPDDYRQALCKLKSLGIKVTGSFILGFDEDTPKDYLRLIGFWMRAGLHIVSLTMLTPFPGTSLFEKLKSQNRILTYDWRKYDSMHHVVFQPKNMSPRALQLWYVIMRLAGILTSQFFLQTIAALLIIFLSFYCMTLRRG